MTNRGSYLGFANWGSPPTPAREPCILKLDDRTTGKAFYRANMKRRFLPEPVFGWIKGPGRTRQTQLKGTEKVGWELHLYCIAYNLRRMAKSA